MFNSTKHKTHLIFCLLLLSSRAFAQLEDTKIQALFVLKFVEQVSWPGEKKNIVIGVLGDSEIKTEIESRLNLKNPNGLTVKKISASDINSCDLVFLPSKEDKHFQAVLKSTSGIPILLITESDLASKGSCISFFEEAGKLRFAINKDAIEKRSLKVSGSILSLSKKV
jgi:hypothetical protein